MSDVSMDSVVGQFIGVLDETFIYKPKSFTYFTDNKPDAGFLGFLESISAADASRLVGGTSIAAHTHHVIFSLADMSAWVRGDHGHRDWKESWRLSSVDDAIWANMKVLLRGAYLELRSAVRMHAGSNLLALGGTVGLVAHMAFHLGAIRQKAAVLQQK